MQDIAVLLVAYRRDANLRRIFDLCVQAGVPRIYISMDGARGVQDQEDVARTQKMAQDLRRDSASNVFLNISAVNLGAARSVISACGWAFKHEDYLIILEDDCIPSLPFFEFCADAKRFLETDSDIFMASGSQFAPKELLGSKWALSKYPLIWGWMTSREKWQVLMSKVLDCEQIIPRKDLPSYIEYSYWNAGARRSMEGYIDAWDIPVSMAIQQLQGMVIHPSQNLVTNIGQDLAATHTKSESEFLGKISGDYISCRDKPAYSKEVDTWYRESFYKIRSRHLFTVRFTKLLDRLKLNSRVREPLGQFLREIIPTSGKSQDTFYQ